MRTRMVGYMYCGLAMVAVGSTVVASKLIAAGMPPFTATALRFFVAFPILVGLMYLTHAPWPRPDRRDRLLLLIQAAAGSVGYTVLLIAGMGLTSAVNAGVITGTLPAVAAVLAILVLKDRPERATLGTLALASAGVLFVTVRFDVGSGGFAVPALVGNALVFGAVACEASFILLHKKLRTPVAPLPLSALMTGIGFALAVVPSVLEQPWTQALNAASIAGVVYYATVPTVGGFLLWYAGSMRISGLEASLLTALAPISAIALAAVLFREPVAADQLVGATLVLAAILLAASQGLVDKKEPALGNQGDTRGE